MMACFAALCWLSAGKEAHARVFALVIGNNSAPPSGGRTTPPLQFADDDAMAFYELQREQGNEAILLVAPDSETRRRHPLSIAAAEGPTMAAVDRSVVLLKSRVQADIQAGNKPTLFIYYSGHGVRGADGQ